MGGENHKNISTRLKQHKNSIILIVFNVVILFDGHVFFMLKSTERINTFVIFGMLRGNEKSL